MSDTGATSLGGEGAEPEAAVEAAPPREPDPLRDPLVQALEVDLGADLIASAIERNDVWVRVATGAWFRAFEVLKTKHDFDYFCFVSGIDWKAAPDFATRNERTYDPAPLEDDLSADGLIERGITGGDTRFQVFGRVYSIQHRLGITVKADLDSVAPSVQSIVPLYRGADWHEREAWEMFGFDFVGHPGLRHLYLPSEFEGNPMRKDFPLLAREVKPWPGLVDVEPLPGGDDEEAGGGEAS